MSDSETYKELGALTKSKERWEESIPYVSSLLTSASVKIQAKALWMLPVKIIKIELREREIWCNLSKIPYL